VRGVHISEAVRSVRELQATSMELPSAGGLLIEYLDAQAEVLLAAHRDQDERVAVQVSNWHPEHIGCSAERILEQAFEEVDAHTTIAREHGFAQWSDLDPDARFDGGFERAIDGMLAGDLHALVSWLDDAPEGVGTRSPFGHHATALHYLGANGVETWRQVVPASAAALAQYLVRRGADRSATMSVYGGQLTAYALAMSSAHPFDAGVAGLLAGVLDPTS
jgi:hypothetical protein